MKNLVMELNKELEGFDWIEKDGKAEYTFAKFRKEDGQELDGKILVSLYESGTTKGYLNEFCIGDEVMYKCVWNNINDAILSILFELSNLENAM